MTTFLILMVTFALPLTLVLAARFSRGATGVHAAPTRVLRRTIFLHLAMFGIVYLAALAWAVSTARADEQATSTQGVSSAGSATGGGRTVGDGVAMLGVALATGLSVLGAGYAVGVVGAAALGAITEKPEMFGRTLVFIGLAEGLAIYGLIVSILLLERLR